MLTINELTRIDEINALLSIVQRMLTDLKDNINWTERANTPRPKSIQTPVKKRIYPKKPPSRRLNEYVRRYAERNPDATYEEIAAKYNVHISKIVKCLGTYITKGGKANGQATATE